MDKLLPDNCPCCGNDKVSVYAKKAARKSGWQCECRKCGLAQRGKLYGSQEAAVAAWNTRAPMPSGEVEKIVSEAMQDAWNDICADTYCHPLDVKQTGNRCLEFTPGHWTSLTGQIVANRLKQGDTQGEK